MERSPKIKVVVVDDETVVLDVIRRYLEKKGCDVKAAEGAFEAFSLLAEVDPDLWIIDIKLPGIDGLELAKRIRTSDPKTGILLMTGYPDSEVDEKVNQLNVIKLLEKPIDPVVLNELVGQAGPH